MREEQNEPVVSVGSEFVDEHVGPSETADAPLIQIDEKPEILDSDVVPPDAPPISQAHAEGTFGWAMEQAAAGQKVQRKPWAIGSRTYWLQMSSMEETVFLIGEDREGIVYASSAMDEAATDWEIKL